MSTNPSVTPSASPFRLFISFAHENEACKDRLKTHLAPLERNGIAKVWDDRAISAGALWRKEIEDAMVSADAVIFLLDENFIASDFCMDVEVPEFLKHHHKCGTLIIFVVTDYCGWDDFHFISQHKIIPLDGRPITSYKPYSKAYTHIKDEIKNALALHRTKLPAAASSVLTRRAITTDSAASLSFLMSGVEQDSSQVRMALERNADLDSLLTKLPGATPHLFGRDTELAQINSWKDHKGLFLWVADGGTGKSALVRWWLEHQEWPAGALFLGHSFYSQGSHNQATSARSFLLDALKQLNVTHEINAADDELGRLLAKAVAKESTVLVLDGIEPLQQISEDEKLNGLVKDRGLAALLEELVKSPGKALCLASSRLPIPDVSIADGSYFKEKTLGLLPPDGALLLLRQRGVRGEDDELGSMAERCGYHPLALVLAAEFCHTFLQGRAAEFLQREWQPKTCKAHASTIMTWFDSALADENQALDRELARILGLFDRPAPWGALLALKQAASIPGLTAMLHDSDETTIIESLSRLSQWGLLNADLTRREPELDAHPLVREHFGALLEREASLAWKTAHSVLFDWFRGLPVKEQLDTPEELEPLYRAIGHGCKAGMYRTALGDIYRTRILRSDLEAFSLFRLGAYSSDLGALSGFFICKQDGQGIDWCSPVLADSSNHVEDALSESLRSWLRGHVAFCLMSVGRLNEAMEPRTLGRKMDRDSGDWNEFCISSNNLSDLLAVQGHWEAAEHTIRESLMMTEKIENHEQRSRRNMIGNAYLARILHGQGRFAEARAAFREAEQLQNFCTPKTPRLYSLRGYDYAQFLIESAKTTSDIEDILERGRYALEIDRKNNFLLFQALCSCVIGQSLEALGDSLGARENLNQALMTIKRSGYVMMQPLLHLSLAKMFRFTEPLQAWDEYENAFVISQSSNMRTYLAECALLAGNLFLDAARIPETAAQYATASLLIREDSYGRRYAELYLLHTRLLYAQHDPAALQTLAEAEARIREVGQWFFWRELQSVAKEIGAPDPGKCPA